MQTKFAIQAMGALVIDLPALAPEQHMDATIPVSRTRRSELHDPQLEAGLIRAAGLIALGRSIDRKRTAGSPFVKLVARLQIADDLSGSIRPYIFRQMRGIAECLHERMLSERA